MSAPPEPEESLAATVDTARVIVCTGSGGVGKTTVAAALGVAAAARGRRTIVVTIDPARRLAQSLGLAELDNVPRRVAGAPGLDAVMLDMKRTFDDVIDRHAPNQERARNIKGNRFYEQLSGSLAGTQEYMAMEKLHELHETGDYECIVVDTPPTRNALDFLDAPRRLTGFLEGRFLRMFLAPGMVAGRLVTRAASFGTGLFMKAASRITGAGVLEDLAEFFQSFQGMYEGFKERAQEVYDLLQSPEAAFVVVASPETPALREARFFLQRLAQEEMPTAGLVVNRVTPDAAEALAGHDPATLSEAVRRLEESEDAESSAAAALLRLGVDRGAVAVREHRTIDESLTGVTPPVVIELPLLASDVHDLDTLTELGARLAPA